MCPGPGCVAEVLALVLGVLVLAALGAALAALVLVLGALALVPAVSLRVLALGAGAALAGAGRRPPARELVTSAAPSSCAIVPPLLVSW
ncbi:hypothetical protein [Arthrobacter rhombi]|uniref:hypothetical protein n=1 Tax=Arthrobacter rhombi TaxID=71253 RepID=UPI003FD4FF8F